MILLGRDWPLDFMENQTLKSLAHPNWPYAGTPWEWRGFAKKDSTEIQDLMEELESARALHDKGK